MLTKSKILSLFGIILLTTSVFTNFNSANATISATGGTITYASGREIHTFTSSGTFTVISGSGNVQVLVVAGGGGGSAAGAGGVIYTSNFPINVGSYTVTIGAGGTGGGAGGGANGAVGSNSTFGSITAVGGGGGVKVNTGGLAGGSGGAGSGSGLGTTIGGSATTGQGNVGGGNGGFTGSPFMGGGGGGAGGPGGNAISNSVAGAGGVGYAYSISGSSVYYGGGGGGESYLGGGTAGAGGNGGGGNGVGGGAGANGAANSGGGGGAADSNGSYAGGNGGSGIVIISIPIVPSAPTLNKANTQSSSTIIPSWSASTGATWYLVYRESPTGHGFAQITNTTGLSYVDSGLTAGTQYNYEIFAGNSSGISTSASNTKSNYTTSVANISMTQWHSLKEITLYPKDLLYLADTTPFQITVGHVAMYVPCDGSGTSSVTLYQGTINASSTKLTSISPVLITGLSITNQNCLYHFDIGTSNGVTDFVLNNTSGHTVTFNDRNTLSFTFAQAIKN